MTRDRASLGRIAVFADDLSGALASAASLAGHFGERVPVVDELPDPVPPRVVLNTHARADGVRGDWLADAVRAVFRSGTRLFDKRMDSTLRGPAAEEIRIMLMALPEHPTVVAVPAYPGAGRTTRSGEQWHGRTRVGRVADALGAPGIGAILGGTVVETAVRARRSPFQPDNPGPYVLDVRHRHELQRVARVINEFVAGSLRPLMLVSSGELLHYVPVAPPRPVVVVWASGSDENHRQLQELLRVSDAVLVPLWDPPAASLAGSVRILVSRGVKKTPGPTTDRALGRRVLDHLDAWSRHGFRPARLVVSGGDTAQAVLREAGAGSLEAVRNPAPLVGSGIIRGGALHGLELITKGGKVGGPELLVDLVELLWEAPCRFREE